MDLPRFVEKWSPSAAAEHSNAQSFLNDLCDVLAVERPHPAVGDPKRDRYVFEKPVTLAKEDGATVGHVDLYKEGCFILEAKQGSNTDSKRIGTARRGTPAWNIAMQGAYGQALGYARSLDHPPPFIVTTDIGHCFDFYAAFDGSGSYHAFPNAQTNRVYLKDLAQHIETFKAVFTDPRSLDPAHKATKVTREVAGHLAELARVLEEAKNPPERVAKFLMRCIFTMFAEDVGLLPDKLFSELLKDRWLANPPSFVSGIRSLWKAMNEGSDYVVGKLLQFNGGLFKEPDALTLTAEHLALLLEAANCDWSQVEPAIFGTLLERALDPHERQKLGAHYTPRAYVERLVRPTIEEPMRAEWDLVRGQVRQLVEGGKETQAKKVVSAYYDKLCHTRVLDPACGTGNFLYVTMDLFKRLEAEVVSLLGQLEEKQMRTEVAGFGVTPQQFLGIEVKPWAKEIAELVLWIGYLQWHFRTRGHVAPPEPVLRDYGNIILRDAVLAYESERLRTDERGRPTTHWDGRSFKSGPTGALIPDESAQVPEYEYVGPSRAEWPRADFIVGNPPFVGNKRMRFTLGDGYVEALRQAHSDVPDTSDFVMYWWNKAAHLLRAGQVRRFGLITTNSITQVLNRKVVEAHLTGAKAAGIVFAIPDHPWADSETGAAVRIAMTVAAREATTGRLCTVIREADGEDESVKVDFSERHGTIHSDLTIGPAVARARPLRANTGLCQQGVKLVGDGFLVSPGELRAVGGADGDIIKPFLSNKDLVQRPRGLHVVDFFGLDEREARERHAAGFQRVYDRVRPFRLKNRDAQRKREWWLFGRSNERMRRSLSGLERFIVTPEVAKHRPFVFLTTPTVPDASLYVVGSADAYVLGVLSSRPHLAWALAAGGHLGVGNDPRYQNGPCFEPFPFPECDRRARERIRRAAEALDEHRRRQQRKYPDLTLTGMYNVLANLRAGRALSAREKVVHEHGLVSVLGELHDEVDSATLEAYGWPHGLTDEQLLERLVALNAQRSEEEARGLVRWVRPEFQNPEGARQAATQVTLLAAEGSGAYQGAAPASWPKKVLERIAAVRNLLAQGASWSAAEVAKAFKGAKRADVEEVLAGLAALGLAVSFKVDGVRRWRAAGRAAA